MGVMFPGATVHTASTAGTTLSNTKFSWNITTTLSSIQDGLSNTILLGESTTAGYAAPGQGIFADIETNWACPHPAFTSFMASDNVCGASDGLGHDRHLLQRQPRPDERRPAARSTEGTGISPTPRWVPARPSAMVSATLKGGYPFIDSGHPGGFNVVMCDGSVHYLKNQINGTVFAKLVTSAGSKLPPANSSGFTGLLQLPVNQDQFAQ